MSMQSEDYLRIERAIDYIVSHHEQQPGLADMATAAGLSSAHFSRVFKRWSGLSPKQFLEVTTLTDAKTHLRNATNVLDAAHASGLSGPSRLHDLFVSIDGVTPGEYAGAAPSGIIRYGRASSPFGSCVIGTTERGVCYLSFDCETGIALTEQLESQWPDAELRSAPDEIAALAERIFAKRDRVQPGLHLKGTNFQVKVWQALLEVPEAATTSYGALSDRIGRPGAARAVGQAVGQNSIAWLIPCHRVLRANGALGGYRWGPSRKGAMLAWEQAHATTARE